MHNITQKKTTLFYSFISFSLFGCIIFSCKGKNNTSSFFTSRADQAYHNTFDELKNELLQKNIEIQHCEIFIRALKFEQELELFAKNKSDEKFTFIKKYDFCKMSGTLGPKRKEGDLQTPEGLYHIHIFNDKSSYHLSLGINYPNASDLILSDKKSPGGEIFIHGNCVTIGCIPITDEKIEELFTIASIAHKNGQLIIPIHIFPFRMTKNQLLHFNTSYPKHKIFWNQLLPFYEYFEKNKSLPSIKVLKDGSYSFIK